MSHVAANGNLVLELLTGTPASSWQEAGTSMISHAYENRSLYQPEEKETA